MSNEENDVGLNPETNVDESSPVDNATNIDEVVPANKIKRFDNAELGNGAVKCSICEKRSYTAETVYFDRLPFHKDCFLCSKCNKRLELSHTAQFDDFLYCTPCFNNSGFNRLQTNVTWKPKSVTKSNTLSSRFGGGGSKCHVCTKTVYPAETVQFEGKKFHRECFSCSECSYKPELSQAFMFEDNMLCKKCWDKGDYNKKQLAAGKWDGKTSSTSPSSPTINNPIASKFGGGGAKCFKCDKTVYPAETVQFEGKKYHNECFSCSECSYKPVLSQANMYDDQIFCQRCWERGNYNQKQLSNKSIENKPSSNPLASKFGGGGIKCHVCTKTVYPAELVQFEGKKFHQECFACKECSYKPELSQANMFEDDVLCKKCWEKGDYNKKQLASSKWEPKTTTSNPLASKFGGGGNKCFACSKTVYPAETLMFEKQPYHTQCFACTHCAKRIEQLSHAEHKNLKPYCKKCFQDLGLWRATA